MINSLNNTANEGTGVSIMSWPALLSCFVAVCGILVLARAAYGLGDTTQSQDAIYRRDMFMLCSGFVLISCAVAINKFVE